jgi:hypothetical protein
MGEQSAVLDEAVALALQLSASDRERLIERIAATLTHERTESRAVRTDIGDQPPGTLRELKGLGKHIWDGQEAQKYVDRLRDEWD